MCLHPEHIYTNTFITVWPHYTTATPHTTQELMSERARLAAEVESLKASTVAEASSSKAELGAARQRLEQQAADVAARTEALAAGGCGCVGRAS